MTTASTAAMGAGLVAGYGAFGVTAARFLYPAGDADGNWSFVAVLEEFAPGTAMTFRTPAGATVAVVRKGEAGSPDDFIALSGTCPHLGCQVHWESANNRFFCPCHNGSFDPEGNPTGGPPKAANQSLPRFPLKVDAGVLYIALPDSLMRMA